jgi:hypothetical protein
VVHRSPPITTSSKGVGIIEVATGNTLATLQFANGVEEIYDVQTISGARCPTFGGSVGVPQGRRWDCCPIR